VKIDQYESRPPIFWETMGPFFACREYRKEMPYLTDDAGYVWFLAWRDELAGFACAHESGEKVILHSVYVLKDHRGFGVAKALYEARIEWAASVGAKRIEAICNPSTIDAFRKRGFSVASSRGKYNRMVKDIA
jgi:GNAT superfamily N-acetyltransferase